MPVLLLAAALACICLGHPTLGLLCMLGAVVAVCTGRKQ